MDARRFAPAAERNKGPILEVLRPVLPARGLVLEVASGSGQHVAHFARALPQLQWQPSELDRELHASIAAHCAGLPNVRPPIALDAREPLWPLPALDAIWNANMIHIAPFETCLGLLKGAARQLVAGGVLAMYGPYRIGQAHTAPSNAEFDLQLRGRDPHWGVRDLEAVVVAAQALGLAHEARHAMPANNQLLVFRKP